MFIVIELRRELVYLMQNKALDTKWVHYRELKNIDFQLTTLWKDAS